MLSLAVLALMVLVTGSSAAYDTSPAFSPDGLSIAFSRSNDQDASSVIIISPVQNPSLRVLGPGKCPEYNPDGLHLLYLVESPDKEAPTVWLKQGISNTHTDICVTQMDTGEITQLTRQGGACPIWSADGGEIAYFNTSGALCSIPITGGTPKKIASRLPCRNCLTWLPDWKSFAATQTNKGKMARYAFSPPSRTPVRISAEFAVPTGAVVPTLNEDGTKMAYFLRKQAPDADETYPGMELWAAWQGGKRKVADIPLDSPLSVHDAKQSRLTWSTDSKQIAAACGGKVWVVELASGKMSCISDAAVAANPSPEKVSDDSNTSGSNEQDTGNSQ